MTDFLARIAARVAAPSAGLRPNTPSRFEPTPGLAGEPGLFEVTDEREIAAPPASRAAVRPVPPGMAPALVAPTPAVPLETPSAGRGETPSVAPPPPPSAETGRGQDPLEAPPAVRTRRLPAPPAESTTPAPRTAPPRSLEAGTPGHAPPNPSAASHSVEHHHHHLERVVERTVLPPASPTETSPAIPPVFNRSEPGRSPAERSETAPLPASRARPHQARTAAPTPPLAHDAAQARLSQQPASEAPPPPAPVVVRIDRLEVRVAPPRSAAPAPATPRQARPDAAPDLDHYLAQTEGRRS